MPCAITDGAMESYACTLRTPPIIAGCEVKTRRPTTGPFIIMLSLSLGLRLRLRLKLGLRLRLRPRLGGGRGA